MREAEPLACALETFYAGAEEAVRGYKAGQVGVVGEGIRRGWAALGAA